MLHIHNKQRDPHNIQTIEVFNNVFNVYIYVPENNLELQGGKYCGQQSVF